MVILEKPYVSPCILKYLADTKISVLKNETSSEFANLNLVDDETALQLMNVGEKIYTTSENALSWIYANCRDSQFIDKISVLKDKAKFRKICASLYPDFYYRELNFAELFSVDVADLKFPIVLKPSVGFLSAGVYVIENASDWMAALENIKTEFVKTKSNFPSSVINDERFLIEEFISGDEYAVDAYFDKNGLPNIVNIFRHPFSSGKDVSDRLYMTRKSYFDDYREQFEDFLLSINKLLDLKNIPIHIEFRISGEKIVPIEINVMRFAGMCLNEIFLHIYGKHPVSIFLNDDKIDYEKMWRGRENSIFSFVILEKSEENKLHKLNFDKVVKIFKNVLDLRVVNNSNLNIFGFLFLETKESDFEELEFILKADLSQFKTDL